MVTSTRQKTVAAVLGALAILALWIRLRPVAQPGSSTRTAEPVRRQARGKQKAPTAALPIVGLDRLERRGSATEAGGRDVFAFGRAEPGPSTFSPPVPVMAAPPLLPVAPVTANGSGDGGGPSGGTAPVGLKFIGAVQATSGTWVAAILTDSKEVVTGREGDTIAQRYRVAHIGLESIDLVDVISGREHRIRLGGK